MSNVARGSSGPMSGTPTAICGNPAIGLPVCNRGAGKYCYWMKVCSSQMSLNDPNKRTYAAQKLYEMESKRVIEHGEQVAEDMGRDYSDALDAAIDDLIRHSKPWNGYDNPWSGGR